MKKPVAVVGIFLLSLIIANAHAMPTVRQIIAEELLIQEAIRTEEQIVKDLISAADAREKGLFAQADALEADIKYKNEILKTRCWKYIGDPSDVIRSQVAIKDAWVGELRSSGPVIWAQIQKIEQMKEANKARLEALATEEL